MQKSFLDRVFPNPKKAILPQYDPPVSYHDEPQRARSVGATSTSNASDSRSSLKSLELNSKLQPAPMSASIIHHEDPFLSVDRAAQNLQRTIQSLLDFQNEALNGRHRDDGDDTSQRSLTPTHSTFSGSVRNLSTSGAMPLRQPVKKKTTLKGARRGIGKSMHEFAALKNEELRITENERTHRRTALDKIAVLETKRESVQHEMTVLQQQPSGNESNNLRQEAQNIQNEIHEIEGRLMELKVKHRHLTDQAEQMENAAASELSSYQDALSLVDKEVRNFLRHPPVRQGLGPKTLQQNHDMYSLRPERRTLDLAKEQWNAELQTLDGHKTETEKERDALIEGSKIWREVVHEIDDFEQLVRSHMRSNASDPDSTSSVVASLDKTMHFLEQKLHEAEAKDWKLLICAIGPELESFRQARTLLAPEDPLEGLASTDNEAVDSHSHIDEEDSDIPHADLLNEQSPSLSFRPTVNHRDSQENGFSTTTKSNSSSNESLKATLKNTVQEPPARLQNSVIMKSSSGKLPERRDTRYSESEDDDPGPDFLVSH